MNPHPVTSPLPTGVTRRTVLGVTAAGAAGLLTAACGGSSPGTAAGSDPTPSDAGSSARSSGSSSLVATADVPVGGGVFVEAGKIIAQPGPHEQLTAVVTQPTKGEFKAFSAVCTHMGCTVGEIKNGSIICPCHGSRYSIKDGSVQGGPSTKALAAIAVKVSGDKVVEA